MLNPFYTPKRAKWLLRIVKILIILTCVLAMCKLPSSPFKEQLSWWQVFYPFLLPVCIIICIAGAIVGTWILSVGVHRLAKILKNINDENEQD